MTIETEFINHTNKIFKVFERLCDVGTLETGISHTLAERIVSIHMALIGLRVLRRGSAFTNCKKEEEDMHGI